MQIRPIQGEASGSAWLSDSSRLVSANTNLKSCVSEGQLHEYYDHWLLHFKNTNSKKADANPFILNSQESM